MGLRERKLLRTQSLLYDTAVALFSEHGYKAVTVDDNCAAADVAPATLFHYFGTKAGLMVEFDRRTVVEIEQSLPTTKTGAASRLSVIQVSMSKAWSVIPPVLMGLGSRLVMRPRPTSVSG